MRSQDVKGLIRALRYEDPVTDKDGRFVDLGVEARAGAATALATLAGAEVYEALAGALTDPEEKVRMAAIHALRDRGDRRAVGPMISLVTSHSGDERALSRETAVRTLSLLRDPEVARRATAELLARGEELNHLDLAALADLARAGGSKGVQATVGDLLAHLREASAPDRARRLVAALAPESVEPLIAVLGDETARHEAVVALGSIHDSRAVEPLSSVLLRDEDPSVRSAAARALGELRHPAAVEPLLLATSDRDYNVRTDAIAAFDGLGNAAIALAVRTLAHPALEDGAGHSVEALGATPNGPALPPVEDARVEPRAGPLLRRLLGR